MTPTEALDQLREAFAALGFEVADDNRGVVRNIIVKLESRSMTITVTEDEYVDVSLLLPRTVIDLGSREIAKDPIP